MELKRVVVTGLGALTPIGNTKDEFWDALISGKSGAAPITYFDTEKFKTKFACEVKNFNIEEFIDRKESRRMDKFAQYAIVSSEEAIKDSRLIEDDVDKDRVGVIWGAELCKAILTKFFFASSTAFAIEVATSFDFPKP